MNSVTTPSTALWICIVGLLLWGLWATTWKMAGKWRFELYTVDFGLGAFIATLALCFTVGFFTADITFLDNLAIVRIKQIGFPLLAGILAGLGILMLMGAISLAGLAVGLTAGMGTAITVGAIWSYFLFPKSNPVFLFSGGAILLVAILLAAYAFKMAQSKKNEGLPLQPSVVSKRPPVVRHHASKAVVLAALSGIFLGCIHPLLTVTQTYEVEMGPFAILFLFGVAILLSCLIFNVYFFNLPVEGKILSMRDYFKSPGKQHAMGFLGGAIWTAALAAYLVLLTSPFGLAPVAASSYAAALGASVLSAAAGLAIWGELGDAPDRARIFLLLSLPALLTGAILVSLAAAYPR